MRKCIILLSLVLTAGLLLGLLTQDHGIRAAGDAYAGMDRFDRDVGNCISGAMEGILSLEKVYWLSDQDQTAPVPDPEAYGYADTAEERQALLDRAWELLEGQETLFTPETPVMPGSTVQYYLDETLFAVTWKEIREGCVYTCSEVKIAHPSQLRRFLAGGEYGCDRQFTTTEMARSVNAVVASSGDFYRFRQLGAIIYEGTVRRVDSALVDTCHIAREGNLRITRAGELPDAEAAQKYADDYGIRFSLNFGPVLVEEGQRCEPGHYLLGEISEGYARAAIGQLGPLHYLLTAANGEHGWQTVPDIHSFAANLEQMGCETAYALDGGQTAAIAMDGQLVNRVVFGQQRKISDIVYFATALPGGG